MDAKMILFCLMASCAMEPAGSDQASPDLAGVDDLALPGDLTRPCQGVIDVWVDNRTARPRIVPGDGSMEAPLFSLEEALAPVRSVQCGEAPGTQWRIHLVESSQPYGAIDLRVPRAHLINLTIDRVPLGNGGRVTLAATLGSVVYMNANGWLNLRGLRLAGGTTGVFCVRTENDPGSTLITLEDTLIEYTEGPPHHAYNCGILMEGGAIRKAQAGLVYDGMAHYQLDGVQFTESTSPATLVSFLGKSWGTFRRVVMRRNTSALPPFDCASSEMTFLEDGVLQAAMPYSRGMCNFNRGYVFEAP